VKPNPAEAGFVAEDNAPAEPPSVTLAVATLGQGGAFGAAIALVAGTI